MRVLGIIPARYASTRFPGKPLAMIGDKTMLQRVYERASKAGSLTAVIIATDDQRIYNNAKDFCSRVIMTSPDHQSGTERCGETLSRLHSEDPTKIFDIVVNIQGDEPFLEPEQIDRVVSMFSNPDVQIATLAKKITREEELNNPNSVKVVTDINNKALYFSRYAIPYYRSNPENERLEKFDYFKHIGLYAYRTDILLQICTLPPSQLELAESLEQLRWIQNGYSIAVGTTNVETPSIDTPEDLLNASKLLTI